MKAEKRKRISIFLALCMLLNVTAVPTWAEQKETASTKDNTVKTATSSDAQVQEEEKCEEKEEAERKTSYTDIFDLGLYFEDTKHKTYEHLDKITYDDVLEAHDFIQNFEENWRRFLDNKKYNHHSGLI